METYNGWTNYQTWRIMLEVFDGIPSPRATAESCKAYVLEYLDESIPDHIARGWAEAFLEGVNWEEIAEALRETGEDD
jgi:hypothetical protein